MSKDTSIPPIRVPHALKDALIKLAEADRRTLSDFLRLHYERIIKEAEDGKKKDPGIKP